MNHYLEQIGTELGASFGTELGASLRPKLGPSLETTLGRGLGAALGCTGVLDDGSLERNDARAKNYRHCRHY